MATQPNPTAEAPTPLEAGLAALHRTHDPDAMSPIQRLAVVEWLHRHPNAALFDSDGAAVYIGFKPASLEVSRCRRTGPPWIRCGRLIRYKKADLDGWLDTRTAVVGAGR